MAVARKIKVILDTNIWISYLISHRLSFIDELIYEGRITLVLSDELLEEFIEVARRPKLQKFFSNEDLLTLLELLVWNGTHINPKSQVNLCRDPKDNFLLNLAMDAKADFLVTGDGDLLDLKTIGSCQIITLKDFSEIAAGL
jgi:uncharacterized protein